jgi:hypothetical protein
MLTEDKGPPMSIEARVFAEKAARSVSELQYGVNNIADVVVFLEILGYDDRVAYKHGFIDLMDLAKYLYPILDHYENPKEAPQWSYAEDPLPGKRQRLSEALGIYAPWLGALVVLNIAGFSLWMAQLLPADITIAFIAGVFSGLILTEWPLQAYSRTFFMYYEQKNIGEIKRSVVRSYATVAIIMSCFSAIVASYSVISDIPLNLTFIAIGAAATVSIHRLSFNILYSLKKIGVIFLSYAAAFAILIATFYSLPEIIALDMATRYFASLAAAFVVLTSFAAYYHLRLHNRIKPTVSSRQVPDFYRHPATSEKTLVSKFRVQLWESLPFSVYGTFYLIILFGDRILSWIFNPNVIVASNGTLLPMVFNPEYHVGADVALLALAPVIIVQYIIMTPVYSMFHNRSLKIKISEIARMDTFVRRVYQKLLILSLITSLASVAVLFNFGIPIVSFFNGTETSMQIMRYASLGSIGISVFTASAVMMMFLNRAKIPAFIAIAGGIMVIVIGSSLAQNGIEGIAFGYLLSSTIVAALSFFWTLRLLKERPSTNLFARYS